MASAPKRFKTMCINTLYRSAYGNKFCWEEILPRDMAEFFSLYAVGYNCPTTVSIGCIVPLCATLCGPDTVMEVQGSTFITPLNIYNMIVCAPGGGKSVAFQNIMQPIFDKIKEEKDINIHVENYSTAGLQRHQEENNGYAILTSDEGHRILSAINNKQHKCEAERALLNKLWGGCGDSTTLVGRDRGFGKTAFSISILIQPSPLLSELSMMGVDDGFLDRFSFYVDKPKLHQSGKMKEAIYKIKSRFSLDLIANMLISVFNQHFDRKVVYKFEPLAQQYYDRLSDEHVIDFNSMYPDSDEDDNDMTVSQRLEKSSSIPACSKDLSILPRLASIMHIITTAFNTIHRKEDYVISTNVTLEALTLAEAIMVTCHKQKSLIMETVFTNSNVIETPLNQAKPISHRVWRKIVQSPGPMIHLRDIYKNISGVNASIAKAEVKLLQQNSFGKYMEKKGKNDKDVFLKPHPDVVEANCQYVNVLGCDHDIYVAKFNDITRLSEDDIHYLQAHHPHFELMNLTQPTDE